MTKAEVERYSRQISIPGWGLAGQERLKAARVGVAGAGGLGSAVLLYLVAAGLGSIVVVDRDRVSLSNLNRQVLHWSDDVGRAKTVSASEKLARLNPETVVDLHHEDITEMNIDQLFGGVDVLVDCLDNFPTRYVANDYVLRRRIPLVHGAVWGMEGRLTVILPGRSPCLRCLYRDAPPPEVPPVLGATAAVVGSLQASETIRHCVGLGEELPGRLLVYDGARTEFVQVSIRREPTCPSCAGM